MESFIGTVTVILLFAYVAVAIWVICKRQTILGCVATSAGFLFGGLIIVPVMEAIATFICWGIIITAVLAVVGAFSEY